MAKFEIGIGVMGLPIRKRNNQLEFLLSQRNQPGKPLWHLKWQQIGGGLEFGETPKQTLAREFEEEAKVKVRILWKYPIIRTSTWDPTSSKSEYHRHILLMSYIVSIDNQNPDSSADEETADIKWYSFDEAMTLDSLPNLKEFLIESKEIITKEKLI